jgi:hypothetical protein
LNSAHAALGLGAYRLPADFDSLPPADQLLILSNLDRIAYGLPAISGLSPALDSASQLAVAEDTDPDPDPDLPPGLNIVGWWSNWAGGYANALLAYYGWMYDDGIGSPNIDCRSAGDPGCWGHRQDVLAMSDAGALVMGAAAGTDPYREPGYAMTIVGTASASTSWTTLSYTWTEALADIGGSGSSGGSGAGSGSGVSGSGSSSGSGGSGSGSSGATGSSGASGASAGDDSSGSGSSSGSGGSSGAGRPPVIAIPSGSTGTATPASITKSVPPTAVITRARVNARAHAVRFVLLASGTPSGFQCALVRRSGKAARTGGPRYAACGAVRVYTHLAAGRYTFYARALGPPGSDRKAVRRSFSIG